MSIDFKILWNNRKPFCLFVCLFILNPLHNVTSKNICRHNFSFGNDLLLTTPSENLHCIHCFSRCQIHEHMPFSLFVLYYVYCVGFLWGDKCSWLVFKNLLTHFGKSASNVNVTGLTRPLLKIFLNCNLKWSLDTHLLRLYEKLVQEPLHKDFTQKCFNFGSRLIFLMGAEISHCIL